MKINSRTVNFYEIHLQTHSLTESIKKAAQTPMSSLLPFLAQHIPANFEIKYADTPIEVTVPRWDAAANELHLLLNIVDPEKSDVAYRRRTTRSRRLGNKTVDEDIEVSSHVVIRAIDGSPVAQMAMTTGASIPPGKIVALLKDIYKLHAKSPTIKRLINPPLPSNSTDTHGKPKTYKVKHQFHLNGMPNSTLKGIIKTGKIVGVELIDTGVHAFDSSNRISVDRMQMHVEVRSASVDIPFLRGLISTASKKRNLDADKIRIEYIDINNAPDEKPKTHTFDSARLEEAFTRSEKIELEISHHDHQTEISEEIIQKISQLL